MDRETALSALPEVHGNVLRLHDRGLTPAAIALQLAIPPESIGSLLRVAEAKLEALLARSAAAGEASEADAETTGIDHGIPDEDVGRRP